jgi:hypothetical protein
MLLNAVELEPAEFIERTGWEIKPEGACQDDVCVPLSGSVSGPDGTVDVRAFAEQMGMPLARDKKHDLWALGPRAGGRVLSSEMAPEIVLDDFDGHSFNVATLRGQKVLLLAWASW